MSTYGILRDIACWFSFAMFLWLIIREIAIKVRFR